MFKVIGSPASRWLRTYYNGPDHPAKVRLWGCFRRAFANHRFTIPYAENGWITVDETDFLQRAIFSTGCYEPEVWETLSSFADSQEIFWDVGAHIGTFSIKAVLDPRIQEVHAFEPNPPQAEVLRVNLALNAGRYRIYNRALSDRREVRQLFRGPKLNTGLSSFHRQASTPVVEVECCTLDEMVFDEKVPPPTLLKLDVEGWEYQVLCGARRLLREAPPKAIVFECLCDKDARLLDSDIATLLDSRGYHVRHITRPSGVIEDRENFCAAR